MVFQVVQNSVGFLKEEHDEDYKPCDPTIIVDRVQALEGAYEELVWPLILCSILFRYLPYHTLLTDQAGCGSSFSPGGIASIVAVLLGYGRGGKLDQGNGTDLIARRHWA